MTTAPPIPPNIDISNGYIYLNYGDNDFVVVQFIEPLPSGFKAYISTVEWWLDWNMTITYNAIGLDNSGAVTYTKSWTDDGQWPGAIIEQSSIPIYSNDTFTKTVFIPGQSTPYNYLLYGPGDEEFPVDHSGSYSPGELQTSIGPWGLLYETYPFVDSPDVRVVTFGREISLPAILANGVIYGRNESGRPGNYPANAPHSTYGLTEAQSPGQYRDLPDPAPDVYIFRVTLELHYDYYIFYYHFDVAPPLTPDTEAAPPDVIYHITKAAVDEYFNSLGPINPIYVKDIDTWVPAISVQVKNGETWGGYETMWVKDGGIWTIRV